MNAEPRLSASVLLQDVDGKFPMQFRDGNPTSDPLTWALTGGFKDDADPDTLHTAQRELREELGIYASLEDLHYIGRIFIEHRNLMNDLFAYAPKVGPKGTVVFNEGAGGGHLSSKEINHLRLRENLAGTTKQMIDELLWSPWSPQGIAA